ncbi:MAG: DUF6538 domain-containing protein [Devosia sp.]
MARNSNLHRRDGTYYARIYIPKDLQPAFDGKGEKWLSLRTKEHQDAKSRLAVVLDQWAGTFADMRRRQELSPADINVAVWDHYAANVNDGDRERSSRPSEEQIMTVFDAGVAQSMKPHPLGPGMYDHINATADASVMALKVSSDARRRKARLGRLRADLGTGDTRIIEPDADAFLRKNGFQIAKGSEQYRDLCNKLMRADIEQLVRYAERDGGDFTGKPQDPIIVEPLERPAPIGAPAVTILSLFAKYEQANPTKMQADSMKQVRRDVEHFVAFAGPRFLPSKIDRATVAAWMDVLYAYPVKASETNAFKGMSPQEAVAANKALATPKPAIKVNTIRRYMSSLGGFCRWLKIRSVLTDNPLSDMLPEKDTENEREPFTDTQMRALIASPLFTGCLGNSWQDMSKPGTYQIRDHRYWVPLVMAYSGARPGEIAQLQTADVRESHGVWILHITELGDGDKRTKTKGSMRVVPIHSELIQLGFVEHCKAMAQAGHKQVFPEVVIPKTGQIIPEFSREMNRRYLTSIGLKSGPKIVVYSLRHTVVDRLRLAGASEEEIAMLVGHDKPTMTGRYGVEQPGTLKRRAELIESVRYE